MMAQVTMELRDLMNTDFELFDFNYEVDDPNFKMNLEQAITDYYWTYEIGFETPDLFKHKFQTTFTRIISYYNKLYNTTLLEYNPLINSKMSEALEQLSQTTNTENNTSNTTLTGNTTSDNTTVTDQTTTDDGNTKNSDYPQQAIGSSDYLAAESTTTNTNQLDATNTSQTTASNTDESDTTDVRNATGQNDTSYTKTIEGLTGITYQELINLERQNILRLTAQIIDELKHCFILIY